jgi:enoyl-CoA hydratase/carnithine racemase
MSRVAIEERGRVAVLRLTSGATNAIGPLLVDRLSGALDEIERAFEGVVLAGGAKFFSIGLELPELLKLDRAAMAAFWQRFEALVFHLFTLPIPTVCAIAGHAVAGGTILALSCDYRFAADGTKKVGLNEVKLGLPVPYLADLMLRQIVGDRAATAMLYHGEFMPVSAARRIGLVDDVWPPEALEDAAVQKAAALAALSPRAFAAVKANRVETVRLTYARHNPAKTEMFIDCWFSEPARTLLQEAARKF